MCYLGCRSKMHVRADMESIRHRDRLKNIGEYATLSHTPVLKLLQSDEATTAATFKLLELVRAHSQPFFGGESSGVFETNHAQSFDCGVGIDDIKLSPSSVQLWEESASTSELHTADMPLPSLLEHQLRDDEPTAPSEIDPGVRSWLQQLREMIRQDEDKQHRERAVTPLGAWRSRREQSIEHTVGSTQEWRTLLRSTERTREFNDTRQREQQIGSNGRTLSESWRSLEMLSREAALGDDSWRATSNILNTSAQTMASTNAFNSTVMSTTQFTGYSSTLASGTLVSVERSHSGWLLHNARVTDFQKCAADAMSRIRDNVRRALDSARATDAFSTQQSTNARQQSRGYVWYVETPLK